MAIFVAAPAAFAKALAPGWARIFGLAGAWTLADIGRQFGLSRQLVAVRNTRGGIGKAARNWECFEAILDSLRRLKADESLLIQSGKPVGIFRTHADAPRVLIANSNLVPQWATWEHFNELDAKGLAMYGQMTAGSWIYIGSQGIVQGTYETFVEAGRQHYQNDWAGRWILTAGLGGMGGAQPLSVTRRSSMVSARCWFVDGELNVSWNCLDVHLAERGHKTAILFEGEPGDRLDPIGRAQGGGLEERKPSVPSPDRNGDRAERSAASRGAIWSRHDAQHLEL